jgi:hypothetical protein
MKILAYQEQYFNFDVGLSTLKKQHITTNSVLIESILPNILCGADT